jgi:hypothetical protein
MNRNPLLVLLAATSFAAGALPAAPLTEARVTKILNDVKIIDPAAGSHAAKLNDVIKDELGLRTGIKSRSELLFQDDTLTRVGPETYFSFKPGTREMTLNQGTILLQVPKGLGGAKIRTAAITASITGTTIMMEHIPGKSVKVLVLEGSLRLSINGKFGDSLLLEPGKMVITPPNAKRIPDPVTVDLKKVISTSGLVNMRGKKTAGGTLPSLALIDKEIAKQDADKKGAELVDTNLVIAGKGTNILLGSTELIADLGRRTDADANASGPRGPGSVPGPGPIPIPNPLPGDVGPGPSISLEGAGGHGLHTDVTYGSQEQPAAQPIVINSAQDWTTGGGRGIVDVVSDESVTVNSTIKVTNANSFHGNGRISIVSHKTTGTAIAITSSAQLLALLSATPNQSGIINFSSLGGDINIDGTVRADGGSVEAVNSGSNGVVNINNAILHGDVVKVGALGNNGTLNVGGGTIDADSTIKLYAGGSNGTVNFTNDVTLSGNSVKTIRGDTVTVFDGKVVTILGNAPANVFTNHPNYTGFGGNGSTTGTFGGKGAVTQTLGSAPGF